MIQLDHLLYLLPPLTVLLHLYAAPYTKVEESFSLQAVHDILHYGLPTHNISGYLTTHYDHLTFPGAVPRSFIGPLVLSQASTPITTLFGGVTNAQFLVRATLGLLTAAALSYYIHRVRLAYGSTAARFYTLFQTTQFHLLFYASRTLPNTFALIPVLIAEACFLPAASWPQKKQRNHIKLGLYLLTLSAVIFRGEIAVLLAFQALDILLSRRLSLEGIIISGLAGAVMGLIATLAVDSYFWLSSSQSPIFTTPFLTKHLGLLWPEFSAFYFNTIQGSASQWGEESWHYYFSSALPKLLLNPISVLTLPVAIVTLPHAARHLLLPSLSFITTYSAVVKHKEWRFIMYVVPQLTLLSALGATWVWNRRSKHAVYALLSLGILLSIPVSALLSASMTLVSSFNYPGGQAVQRLHHLNPQGTVHMDVLTCMTGATRFLQGDAQGVRWDKTEDEETLLKPEFWEGIEWALVERPEKTIGRYRVRGVVEGFGGVKLYKPGMEVPVRAVSEARKVAREVGLGGEEEAVGLWERFRKDGFGLRRLLGGYWAGVEMKDMIYIVQKEVEEEEVVEGSVM
ncbi:Alg9-like mannosyltransferase family-domain-containing protein [Sphaerosporella brunnea]|uniref:Mannosyltransferase n=1 Tax=Sphaerosporella brunnea TaxID=1250544 RepID=A0A5J5EKK6_9PEZI|nr:Alg9-like mannosyltransferase family-domain-containing protein [Sphaerosporella brunnea]